MNLSGFDVRFSYDSTKIQPSSIETNEVTDDELSYFKLEEEFAQCMEFFTIPYDEDVIEGTLSFDPPVTESDHIIDKEGIGKVINTNGGVLLGKMSFQMTADEFDIGWFQLVEDSKRYPVTGIEINVNGQDCYIAQSTFRFADNTASKDASLSKLLLSSGVVDQDNADNSTYKEYPLKPKFDKDTLSYEVTLLEYLDTMDIKATLNDTKATMKIRVPKKDEENNLIYEEKELKNDIPLAFTLNQLGEPDTNITVIVTAEDGKTTNEYTVVIKRPYGTIKGTIETIPTKKTTGKNKATVLLYSSSATQKVLDWDQTIATFNSGGSTKDTVNATLRGLKEDVLIETQDDGSYEMKVIPGIYDVLIDKEGYLDHIYIFVEIEENETINLGNQSLIAGDIDKNARINNSDIVSIYQKNGISEGDNNYALKFDLDNNTKIGNSDIVIIYQNNSQKREIEDYRGR